MTRETAISLGLILAAVGCATAPAPPPSQTDRTIVTTLDRVIKDQSGIPSNNVLDNYRVTISAISQVTPGDTLIITETASRLADGGSNIETWLTASARDLGTSSDNVSCASKGTLESKINQLVQERIARKPN